MKEGDYIVGINEHDVKWSPHDEVVALIKSSGNTLKLKVVTPMDGKEKVRKCTDMDDDDIFFDIIS